MKKINYIGYGELIWDVNLDSKMQVIKENGGGTTWNILSNLASFDSRIPTYAVGVVGNDENGVKAIQSLHERGIITKDLSFVDKKTNMVYSVIPEKITTDNDIQYSFRNPQTGEWEFKYSPELQTEFPEDLVDENNIIIIENFRKQNLEFIKQAKNKKVCMDIGRKKILAGHDREHIIEFLKHVDVFQISGEVIDELLTVLELSSFKDLIELVHPDLIILTNGKKAVNFIYKENDEYVVVQKKPHVVHNIVDTTGAGDCFFSVIISNYARYCANDREIDREFVDKVFPLASSLSGEVIKQIGGRCDIDTIQKWIGKLVQKNVEIK